MNSNIVKPEKFDHLHLIFHFTTPLISMKICLFDTEKQKMIEKKHIIIKRKEDRRYIRHKFQTDCKVLSTSTSQK